MTILITSFFVVVLFVLGVSFIYKGYSLTSDLSPEVGQQGLSSEEVDSIRSEEAQLKLNLDSMTLKLEKAQEEVKGVQQLESDLAKANLQQEEKSQACDRLRNDLSFVSERADHQALDAVEVINGLLADNEEFKKKIVETEGLVDPQQMEKAAADNQALREQIELNLGKINELEGKLSDAKSRLEQGETQGTRQLDSLTEENLRLKQGLLDINSKIQAVESEVLKTSSQKDEDLRQARLTIAELEKANESVLDLQQQLQDLRQDKENNEIKIQELVSSLTAAQGVSNGTGDEKDVSLSESDAQDLTRLRREKTDLEKGLRSLKDINSMLQEKEKRLQLELNKSRAQALGLAKVCEDFIPESGIK